MKNADNSLPELSALLDQRLALVGALATSLEASRLALIRNDAEAIARGAAHQAELCHQWSRLEFQLRSEAGRRLAPARPAHGTGPYDVERSTQLEAEWRALCSRIRYLTRVHWSLLRHMQRSLGILQRVVDTCAPTYTPAPGLVEPGMQVGAGE
ncbi:MAG: hypothetical protein WA609_10290 [Terriglobales bacterium]